MTERKRRTTEPDPHDDPEHAYRQRFGRAPDVCLFSIGLSKELFAELDRMMVEAIKTGVPVDERELCRRLGWSDDGYERLIELRRTPGIVF